MHFAAVISILIFMSFFIALTCACCMGHIRASKHHMLERQRQAATRPNTESSRQPGEAIPSNHLLIAVIPTNDDSPAQNRFDGNYWGPPPPPYTPPAPNETTTDYTSTATSPSFIANRLQTASPPPQYESPPPYF